MKDDVVHKRKETTKERREQNERYWYIKYLKIYRNGLDRIVVMFWLNSTQSEEDRKSSMYKLQQHLDVQTDGVWLSVGFYDISTIR